VETHGDGLREVSRARDSLLVGARAGGFWLDIMVQLPPVWLSDSGEGPQTGFGTSPNPRTAREPALRE
jgi:hypothetical protein